MKMTLKQTKASYVVGRITSDSSISEHFDCEWDEAVKIIEEKYIKNLDNVRRFNCPERYACWESGVQYDPGKWVGVKFILESDDEDMPF